MKEWKKVRLRDCIREVNERTIENNQYEVLTSSKSGIYSQEEYFDKQVASKDNTGYKILRKGQFTYRSMSDNGTFTINRLENKEIGIVSPAYPVFEVTSINGDYLKYFFSSELFRKAIHTLSQGSTRTALKYKDLSDIELLLPPIEQQEKIVNILNRVDSIINTCKKEIDINKLKVKYQFMELIDKYQERKLKLKDIVVYKKGYAFSSKEYRDKGCRIIRVSDLGEKEIDDNCEKLYIDDANKEKYKEYELNENDLIITTVGSKPPIYSSIAGRAIKVDKKHEGNLLNQNTVRLTVKKEVSPIVLYNMFNTKRYFDYLSVIMRGNANQGNITIEELLQYEVILPNLESQKKMEKILIIEERKEQLLKLKEKKYKKLKKSLMQKLLTGKVRVKI